MQSHAGGLGLIHLVRISSIFETIMRETYRIKVAHALVIMVILRDATIPGTFYKTIDLRHSHLDSSSLLHHT